MKKMRRSLLLLLLTGYGLALFWGYSTVWKDPRGLVDFQCIYYATSSLLHGHDPYNQTLLYAFFRGQTGGVFAFNDVHTQEVIQLIYLPTTFLFVAPFAAMSWGWASVSWACVSSVAFALAVCLIWKVGFAKSSGVATVLVGIVLLNCEILAGSGNAAGIVVSACVIAVWCFVEERFALVGVLCLVVSLMIKPHDSGFIWLYLLSMGGVFRKRALQALALTLVFVLITLAWMSHSAPHWLPELRGNLIQNSAPGSPSDAGPNSVSARSVAGVLGLETVVRLFSDDPRIYHSVTYLSCGALFAICLIATFRRPMSPERTWLALAAIVPLTMLVTYHRPYDAKLLLLAVPACAMLWVEGGITGLLALIFTSAGLLITGDIPLLIFLELWSKFRVSGTGFVDKMLVAVLTRPASLVLLVLAVFYVWVYAQRSFAKDKTAKAPMLREASLSP